MTAAITAVENGVTITNPNAPTLARWAYETHAETCLECLHADGWCPVGRRLLEATQPDRSWVTGYAEEPEMGAVLAVVFEVSVVLVTVTSVRRRAARMRAAANARRARLARVPIRAAVRKDDGPQDAIPAGYPGYRGSIRYIPLDKPTN